MDFLGLLKKLGQAKIRFLVVGGIAVNFHGITRPTKDIDLIVYLEKKNLLRFLKLMTGLGYCPKVPVPATDFADPRKRRDWIKNKNMVVFSFYHSTDMMKVIDVFVRHPLPFEGVYKRRVTYKVDNVIIPVISIQDLIKLKKQANRLQDRSDIKALRKVLEIQKETKRGQKSKKR